MWGMATARSGISFSTALEWRLAAQWAGYRYEDFVELEGDLQSAHVAAYRSYQQIEAVLAEAAAKEARNRQLFGR